MGGLRVLLWVAIVLIATWFLYSVRSVLFPFAIGLFAAALLDPSIRRLRKRGFSRGAAVWTIFLSFFISVAAIVFVLAPIIAAQFANIQGTVTAFAKNSLFPPTRVEQFLADKEALKLREQLGDDKYPVELPAFKAWLLDTDRRDSYYSVFLEVERSELYQHGLPTRRDELIANLDTPVEPGPIDKFIARYKTTLQKFNLPTTRSGFEEMFQIKKNVNELVTGAFGGAAKLVQYFGSSILLLVLTPIITIYILLDYDNFKRRFVTWIPPTIRPATTDLMGDLGDVLAAYVRGLTKSVLLYSSIMALLLTVLGVPYSLFLGLLVGVFYLIPIIGYAISMGVIWLAITTAGDKAGFLGINFGSKGTYTIVCLVTFIVVGVLYDQLIHPRIVGRSVGLHPVVSFFVILSGGAIFGLAGMILAFPIAGMVKVILDRLIRYTTTTSLDTMDLPRIPSRHAAG